MRLAAIGSRGWKDYFAIRDYLEAQQDIDHVISGGADGADGLVALACCDLDIPCRVFLPRQDLPSPQRFHERNDQILRYAHRVVAFWDGTSPGTRSVIAKARRKGLAVTEIYEERAT